MSFTTATAVSRVGDGRYLGEVAPGWDIAGNANGGYLLAVAARAMAAAAGRPDPVTITAHYLSPGKPGSLEVDTTVVKAGKRFTTVSATMSGAGRPVIAVLGTFGDLASDAATEWPTRVEARPPDLPPVEDCLPMTRGPEADGGPPSFITKIDLRLNPDDAGFVRGMPSGQMRVSGWFRLQDDEPVDGLGLLVAVDAFPPTIFNASLPVGWTPTVELTAHVRARPAPGWLRCVFTTRFVTGGYIEEDGEVWDDTGALVAQSRQLALVPRPAPAQT
jgi:acyl-coenzyme A thioesterase PaaI-like protein